MIRFAVLLATGGLVGLILHDTGWHISTQILFILIVNAGYAVGYSRHLK